MRASPALLELIDRHGGSLCFEDFMAYALYDPERGYYTVRIRDVGRAGDFATAATLSTLLAEALAGWIESLEEQDLSIIEVGGGSGLLASALGRRTGREVHLLEISPRLRALQAQALAGLPIRWHDSVPGALAATGGRGIVVSNELVDAFPCRVWSWRSGRWLDLALERQGEEVVEVWRVLDDPRVAAAAPSVGGCRWPEGQRCEVHLSYWQWLRRWLPLLRHGHVLTVDYGDRVDRLYHRRPGGTLRGYLGHLRREGAELYQGLGQQDLTADVNFTDVERWGTEHGLVTRGWWSQAGFLARYARLPETEADAFVADPAGMGGAFQVLWQATGE